MLSRLEAAEAVIVENEKELDRLESVLSQVLDELEDLKKRLEESEKARQVLREQEIKKLIVKSYLKNKEAWKFTQSENLMYSVQEFRRGIASGLLQIILDLGCYPLLEEIREQQK